MKWQVKDEEGNVSFYEPSEVSLRLRNCFLRNQSGTAKKIHQGISKVVCAWIECESVEVESFISITKGFNLSYNPRVNPYWRMNNENSPCHNENIDGKLFPEVLSSDRKLFSV